MCFRLHYLFYTSEPVHTPVRNHDTDRTGKEKTIQCWDQQFSSERECNFEIKIRLIFKFLWSISNESKVTFSNMIENCMNLFLFSLLRCWIPVLQVLQWNVLRTPNTCPSPPRRTYPQLTCQATKPNHFTVDARRPSLTASSLRPPDLVIVLPPSWLHQHAEFQM